MSSTQENESTPNKDNKEITNIEEDKETLERLANLLGTRNKEDIEKELKKQHKFWDKQPVPKLYEKTSDIGPLEHKTVDQIRTTPLDLPSSFEWYDIDVDSDEDMKKIYELLERNYVEDDEAMFRFAYPIEFLRWALKPPKWRRDWHVCVRVKENQKFVAFISAVPAHIVLNKDHRLKMVEINFLCVHKQLRDKRLAPLLIAEITRRVNLQNIWQAVFTAGTLLPKPITKTRYYHRSLNPSKLIDIKFSSIPIRFRKYNDALRRTELYFQLPEKPLTPGFRPMVKKDIPQVYPLLNQYLSKYKLAPEFTKNEFTHWFSRKDKVIYSYVVEDPQTKAITDFGSFYLLPSTIINHPEHKLLNAAYLYFYVVTKTPLQSLIQDLLICAKQNNFDVFNCLDIMENLTFIEHLKFGQGDGNLYYYLYNFKMPDLQPKHIGLTML
jgi:glycylpeptide N-tetradecanoyltransferase